MGSSDSLQPQAIGLIFGFPAVATAAVALRIYSRALTRSFGADDWVICLAIIFYWAETFTSYKVIIYTYIGYNVGDIPKDAPTVLGSKYAYATELIYNPILALVKTSILLFLLRLTGQKKSVRQAIWALLILNGVAAIITFFITVFHCLPIASNWNPVAYPNAKCLNFANFVTGTASVSIFTDFLALMLPTWIVYELQMRWNQKIMLIGILSFGLLTVTAGVVRVILLDNYDRHIPENYTHTVLFCVSTIEVGLSFVAACAPSFKPLVARFLPKLFGASSRYQNGSTGRSGRARQGYNLHDASNFSRNQHERNVTLVEANDAEGGYGPKRGDTKNGITMTTQLEVTWDKSARVEQHTNTSSMESLVRAD
ncbi:hypothetical protein N7456_003192 [Penicillium angulare]|uniref:Rhodopsin domain-containing protein n=1 Tax=Penicillium angulare TaxID=116970 RepID=A0A9W9KII1_9EURO|nr:hypothetical protein N7456_003192 [Penicillium angulare]